MRGLGAETRPCAPLTGRKGHSQPWSGERVQVIAELQVQRA